MRAFLIGITLAMAAFMTTSCGNAETADTETTAPVANWSMTAIVDSTAWQATKVETREKEGTIYITGTNADGSIIELELGEKPGIGIFSIRRGTLQAATYINKEGSKYYTPFAGTTGVINITEYAADSLLGAEFNFSASNSLDLHIISEGKFTAPVPKKATTTPAL